MQQFEYSLVDIQLPVNIEKKNQKPFSVDTFFCTLLKAQQQ